MLFSGHCGLSPRALRFQLFFVVMIATVPDLAEREQARRSYFFSFERADSCDPECRQFRQAQLHPAQAHDYVHGMIH